jgi:hypothetical protein
MKEMYATTSGGELRRKIGRRMYLPFVGGLRLWVLSVGFGVQIFRFEV